MNLPQTLCFPTKNALLCLLLLPALVFAQAPKPKAPAAKPKTTTTAAAKPKTTTPAAKPKPGAPVVKKANPAVVKLVDQAYEQYKANKDKECEATVKKILVLDPKNKDAFMLRANMAMFADNTAEIWKNLDLIYKYNPKEPEIYSQFAVNHLTYMFFSDSLKRVFCRKSILLASRAGEGYASLGLVAAVGGNYEEAIHYFEIGFNKYWKDTTSRTILKLPYARCQYELGQKQEAINTISGLMNQLKGEDRYTCMYMRATYKMEMGQNDVKDDIDSLTNIYPGDIGIKKLKIKYLKSIGQTESLCEVAKEIRFNSEDFAFDISEYCSNLTKTIPVAVGSKLTYDIKGNTFIVAPTQFDYNNEIRFTWYRGINPAAMDSGKVVLTKAALDSTFAQQNYFDNKGYDVLNSKSTVWLSKKQFKEMTKDSMTYIATDGYTSSKFGYAGHEQVEIFDSKNQPLLIDCIKISDGQEVIWYLNDINNPLIVRMALKSFELILVKFE